MKSTKKMVLLAILVSQALVLSIVETWIPVQQIISGVQGVKLGLANIITLIAIEFLGFGNVILIVLLRCILASLFTGGIMTLMYSITGGILSALVMLFMRRKMSKFLSVMGISIGGAVAHNIGQIAVASFLMKEISIFFYLPVLLISGIITGCFVGAASGFLIKALERIKVFTNG